MTIARTLSRAMARIRSKGIRNTAAYSGYVIRDLATACVLDLKYGGKICVTDLKLNEHNPACHTMVHSGYTVLRRVFEQVPLTKEDVLVDVGCGEGRVINFWLSRGLKNKIVGLEINEAVADRTRERYRKYANVTIIQGDATKVFPRYGTVFYMYNPFSDETVQRFAAALRDLDARIVYYTDNYVEHFANAGWTIRPIRPNGGVLDYRASLITRNRDRPNLAEGTASPLNV